MSIDIAGLVNEGVDRTIARNGLLFAVIFYVLSLVNGLLVADLVQQPGMSEGPMSAAPSLGLSPAIVSILLFFLTVVSVILTIGAIRTFVSEETETIPSEYFTRNIALAVLNVVVGAIIFGFVVGIGFLLLIIPGLFLLVSLFFWNYYVVVEDVNFVEGFQRSWAATSGKRLSLFALGVVVVIISLLVNIVFSIPGVVLPDVGAFVVRQLGSALAQIFALATASRTFVRLTDAEPETAAASRQDHAVE